MNGGLIDLTSSELDLKLLRIEKRVERLIGKNPYTLSDTVQDSKYYSFIMHVRICFDYYSNVSVISYLFILFNIFGSLNFVVINTILINKG